MKAIIFFPITLVIVTYAVIGHIIPTYSEARTQQNENEIISLEIEGQRAQLDSITAFTESVARHGDEKDFLDRFVPDDPAEQEVINTLSNFAQKHSASITGLNLSEGTINKAGTVGELKGSLSVIARYDQILALLQDLFKTERLYSFDRTQIEKVTSGISESGDEINLQQELLILHTDFTYGYIASKPAITVAELDRVLSFENIAAIEKAIEKTDPITLKKQERSNPFLP